MVKVDKVNYLKFYIFHTQSVIMLKLYPLYVKPKLFQIQMDRWNVNVNHPLYYVCF